jgi:PAS domain S-box-containing protein
MGRRARRAGSGLAERDGARVVQRIPCAVMALDAEGALAWINAAGARLLGPRSEDLLGRSLETCVAVEHRPRLRQALARARLHTGEALVECDVGVLGGGPRWVELQVTAEADPADGWLIVGRDVRERRALRRAVARQQDELRETLASFLDTAPVGILIADAEGRPRLVNRAARELLGMHALTPLPRWPDAGILWRPDGTPATARDLPCLATLTDGQARREVELEVRRHPLDPVPVLVGTDALRDATGRVVEICTTFTNIAERRHVERQLQHAQRLETVGILAGGIAHDFNNILCAINGYADLALRRANGQATLRRLIGEIQQAGARGTALTRQLLTFSRVEPLPRQVVDLDATVLGMQAMLRRLIGERVHLRPALGAPTCLVRADPGQVEQVLLNLVVNASDAMPAGGRITVRTEVCAVEGPDGHGAGPVLPARHAVLSVSDEGCGMDEVTRQRVFEPFFTTKPPGRGTGLGLSTVYGIVRQNGGFVEVESAPGRGSTFRVHWPCSESDACEVARAAPRASLARPGETVLLVEDESMVRGLLREVLSSAGFAILEASNGREALELHAERIGQVDVLVTDVVMPELNGSRLAEALRARKPALRVLFVSGYADAALTLDEGLDEATAFLSKPFDPSALTAKVRALLDG